MLQKSNVVTTTLKVKLVRHSETSFKGPSSYMCQWKFNIIIDDLVQTGSEVY